MKLTNLLILFLAALLAAAPAGAEQQLSDRQKHLIELTRLPEIPISFSFFYDVSDFDDLLQGDRAARITALRHKLASAETGTAARADANDDIASLLTYDRREKDAKPYRAEAIQLYQSMLKQGSRTPYLLYRAGRARNRLGTAEDQAAARALLLEALRTDPDFCLPYLEMMAPAADSLLKEADSCFQRAAGRKGALAEDLYRLHEFRFKAATLGFFGTAANIVTDQPAVKDEAATFNRIMDEIVSERAITPLAQASRLEPKNTKYQASLGAARAFQLFREIIKRSAAMAQSRPPVDLIRAAAQETAKTNMGLIQEVQERFRFVDKQTPDTYPDIYGFWSVPLLMEGKYEQAEQQLQKAIRLNPWKDVYSQNLLILYLSWPGSSPTPDELTSRFTGMIEKKCATSCSTNERRMLARSWFDAGRYGDVEKLLRAGMSRDEQSVQLRASLAVALLRQQRFEEAIDVMVAARQYLPGANDKDKAHFCSLSAVLLLLMGDEQGALQWLQQAYALNPNDPVTTKLVAKKEK